MEDFVDAHLSNWYVPSAARRFWKGEYEHDESVHIRPLYIDASEQ